MAGRRPAARSAQGHSEAYATGNTRAIAALVAVVQEEIGPKVPLTKNGGKPTAKGSGITARVDFKMLPCGQSQGSKDHEQHDHHGDQRDPRLRVVPALCTWGART